MTSIYEEAVTRLAEASGSQIEIGEDRIVNIMVEDRVVTLKPADEAESALTAFTIVAQQDGKEDFPPEVMARALALNLFGARTDGGHIGLFADALFLSKTVAVEGMSSEALAEAFVVLVRLAGEIERELGGETQSPGDAESAPDEMPLVDFALGGLMQV